MLFNKKNTKNILYFSNYFSKATNPKLNTNEIAQIKLKLLKFQDKYFNIYNTIFNKLYYIGFLSHKVYQMYEASLENYKFAEQMTQELELLKLFNKIYY